MDYISFIESPRFSSRIIEDMKDAVAAYCRSYYSETFEEVVTSAASSHVLEKIRHSQPLNSEEIRQVVIRFLNSWRCRISKERSQDLCEALREAKAYLDKLPPTLEELQPAHLRTIADFFDALCAVENLKGTAAAKTLALLRPELFVMWDAQIAQNYGCSGNGIGYCRFLLAMRDIACHARQSYGDTHPKLEAYLCPTERKWIPPLAKLLDEWNWVRRADAP